MYPLELSNMKKIISLIITITFILTACESQNEPVQIVKDALQVFQESNYDINAPSVTGTVNKAQINGIVENKGNTPVKNIIITYKFPSGKVMAKVPFLGAGKSKKFSTNKHFTKSKRPDFSLDTIEYETVK